MNTLQQIIESLLFYKNEPVSYAWLAKHSGHSIGEVKDAITLMTPFYHDRGIMLLLQDDQVSLVTNLSTAETIGALVKNNEERELSKQALETLAIVAYKKRITKPEIDYIRGVNSIFILRNLLVRGLIEKQQNLADKRSPYYSLSHQAFSYLGISNEKDLPEREAILKKLDELEDAYVRENTSSPQSHKAELVNPE